MVNDGFRYVNKNEYIKTKSNINSLIQSIAKEIKNELTFNYKYIGPSTYNMITINESKYIGYEFNILITLNKNDLKEEDIINIFINAINKYKNLYDIDDLIITSNGITLKLIDNNYLALKHTLDIEIGIINNNELEIMKKKKGFYVYSKETKGNKSLTEKYDLLIQCGLKEFIKYQYLKRKNNYPNKKAILIFSETIAAIYHEFYDNEKSFL